MRIISFFYRNILYILFIIVMFNCGGGGGSKKEMFHNRKNGEKQEQKVDGGIDPIKEDVERDNSDNDVIDWSDDYGPTVNTNFNNLITNDGSGVNHNYGYTGKGHGIMNYDYPNDDSDTQYVEELRPLFGYNEDQKVTIPQNPEYLNVANKKELNKYLCSFVDTWLRDKEISDYHSQDISRMISHYSGYMNGYNFLNYIFDIENQILRRAGVDLNKDFVNFVETWLWKRFNRDHSQDITHLIINYIGFSKEDIFSKSIIDRKMLVYGKGYLFSDFENLRNSYCISCYGYEYFLQQYPPSIMNKKLHYSLNDYTTIGGRRPGYSRRICLSNPIDTDWVKYQYQNVLLLSHVHNASESRILNILSCYPRLFIDTICFEATNTKHALYNCKNNQTSYDNVRALGYTKEKLKYVNKILNTSSESLYQENLHKVRNFKFVLTGKRDENFIPDPFNLSKIIREDCSLDDELYSIIKDSKETFQDNFRVLLSFSHLLYDSELYRDLIDNACMENFKSISREYLTCCHMISYLNMRYRFQNNLIFNTIVEKGFHKIFFIANEEGEILYDKLVKLEYLGDELRSQYEFYKSKLLPTVGGIPLDTNKHPIRDLRVLDFHLNKALENQDFSSAVNVLKSANISYYQRNHLKIACRRENLFINDTSDKRDQLFKLLCFGLIFPELEGGTYRDRDANLMLELKQSIKEGRFSTYYVNNPISIMNAAIKNLSNSYVESCTEEYLSKVGKYYQIKNYNEKTYFKAMCRLNSLKYSIKRTDQELDAEHNYKKTNELNETELKIARDQFIVNIQNLLSTVYQNDNHFRNLDTSLSCDIMNICYDQKLNPNIGFTSKEMTYKIFELLLNEYPHPARSLPIINGIKDKHLKELLRKEKMKSYFNQSILQE